MSALRRYRSIMLCLALGAASAGASAVELPARYRGKATDQAFAALLSMPTARPPEGRWIIPQPPDFVPGDENLLIAYLERQRLAGANLHDRRHFGSLLQHAIRAGLDDTARWLLEHGADPRIGAPGDDALALARRYQRDALATLLIDRYGQRDAVRPVSPPPREPTAQEIAGTMHREVMGALADSASLKAWRERTLAALTALPERLRVAVLADDQAVLSLVAASAAQPAQLAEVLAMVPSQLPVQRAGALLDGMVFAASAMPKKGGTAPAPPPIEAWRLLWKHLGIPVDYARSGYAANGRLLAVFPAEHLGELLESGYARLGLDQVLGCQLAEMSAAQVEARWSPLVAHFPDLPQRAPAMVLDAFRLGAVCWSHKDEDTLGKLRFLQRIGSSGRVDGLNPRTFEHKPAELAAAITAFAAAPADPPAGRLQAIAPDCEPAPTMSLYRRLARSPTIGDEPPMAVDELQWIPLPGRQRCALLLMAHAAADPYRPGDYDSFHGPYTDPRPSCADPQDAFEIWWEDPQGDLQRITGPVAAGLYLSDLTLVEDRHDGQRYYLSSAPPVWMCSPRARLPMLLRLDRGDGAQQLVPADIAGGTRQALLAQCGIGDDYAVVCPGLSTPATGNGLATRYTPTGLAAALEAWPAGAAEASGATLHARYLAAVMSLDRLALNALMVDGVPTWWTRQAILKVSDSALPLADKRRRMAWLFHDHAQLAQSLDHEVIAQLRGWLPLEDWWPVLKVIRDHPLRWNAPLVQVEDDSSSVLSRLDCALQHAQQQLCGGGWRVE